MKVRDVRRLYEQGLKDYEISARLKTPLIQTKHAIELIILNVPSAESKHYINRKRKRQYANSYFVNDDPHYERVNRYVYSPCIR